MDGVNMFIQTPFFCKKFVTLRTVLGPRWIRLKCSFWLFFYLKYFQHEVQFVTFLQNSNVWDAAVRMLFLVINVKVKMESLTNKNKLDSHQSSTHAVANYSFVFLCYFLIFWEGKEVVSCEEWGVIFCDQMVQLWCKPASPGWSQRVFFTTSHHHHHQYTSPV